MILPDGMTPDAIRARFVAFVLVAGISFAVVAILLARKLLVRRRAAALPEAASGLALEDLEALERIGGREGATALFQSLDSPTEFDRAFAALVRDGSARKAISLADASRLAGIRRALGHGRAPAHRPTASTRDLDPQRIVLLRSRPAIVVEVRENGLLLIELGRRPGPIERGRRFRFDAEIEDAPGSLTAEVLVLDAAAGLALVAHAPLAPERSEPGVLA